MVELRSCVQCGAAFGPRREYARFCSAGCRITWNRQNASGQLTGDTALSWSVSAMNDTIQRLGKATGIDLPEALALISESVWWVTLVDATMIRYHEAAYDSALASLGPAGRRATEGTLTGLRFVRNWMGYHADPADFIQPRQDPHGAKLPSPPGHGTRCPPLNWAQPRPRAAGGKWPVTGITVFTSPASPSARPSRALPPSSTASPGPLTAYRCSLAVPHNLSNRDWLPVTAVNGPLIARRCVVPRLGRHQVQAHDFKPEAGDSLHQSPQGCPIRQPGAQGCRVRADGHVAVVKFGTYCGACLTRESDLIHGHGHRLCSRPVAHSHPWRVKCCSPDQSTVEGPRTAF